MQVGLHDELNAPLGLGSNRRPPAAKGGTGIFAVAAVLVASTIIFAETAFLRGAPSWTRGDGAASAREQSVGPDPPPLRLTPSVEASAKPPSAVDPGDQPTPTSPAKPPDSRAAPEPLIIDVQQALAAMRAKDSASPNR